MATSISMEQFRKRFEVLPGQQSQGNGYFSQVFTGIDKFTKAEVSMKFVQNMGDPRLRPTGWLLRRIEKISHPNLLRFHEHLIVEPDIAPNGEKGFELFISENNIGLDLAAAQLKGMRAGDVVTVLSGIINALDALHGRRIGHGNLKPSNVLIQNLGHLHARLTDYGLVEQQKYREAILSYPHGAIAYLAPEQLLGNSVGRNVDFWALGMIAYELFRNKYTFGDKIVTNSEFAARIKSADLPKDINQIPAPYNNLVKACLVRDPALRPRKVATLRKILAGKITWENGREIPVQSPVPQDIYCYNCGTANPPKEITCCNCGKALTGPSFLKNYRGNNAWAVWTIIFFVFTMLPISFFYYGLYKTANEATGEIDIIKRSQQAIEFYNDYIKQPNQSGSGEEAEQRKQIAAIVGIGIGIYYLVFGSLWFLFQMLWTWRASNNLDRLGSHGRRYHPALILLSGVVILLGVGGVTVFPFLAIIAIPVSAAIPLLILQEIWRGSNPTFLVQGTTWKTGKGSTLITSWWLLSMLFPILVLMPLIPTTLDFAIQIEWFYLTIAILLAYCIMYIVVLLRVNYRQATKYIGWASQGGIVRRKP